MIIFKLIFYLSFLFNPAVLDVEVKKAIEVEKIIVVKENNQKEYGSLTNSRKNRGRRN